MFTVQNCCFSLCNFVKHFALRLLVTSYKQFAYVSKIGILSNILHASITQRIEKITMASYYGLKPQITTIQRSLMVVITTAKSS
jgi:hypothetical protein